MLRLIVALVFLCFCAFAQGQTPTESIAKIKQRLQASTEKPLESLQIISGTGLSYQTAQPALHNFKLPSGVLLKAELTRQHADVNGVATLTANTSQGKIRVNKRGNTSITTISTDQHRWKILSIAGESLIYDDYELPARIAEDDAIMMDPHTKSLPVKTPTKSADATSNDGTSKTFDAVILYTQATIDYYEGEDLALARIADIVDTTNEIYADSTIPLIMNLHKTFLIDYDPENKKTSFEALNEMHPESPYFGAAYAYALEAGVDYLITMRPFVSNDGYCGLARAAGMNNEPYDPEVVNISHTSISCSDFTNAHELGHNMGLAHSYKQGEEGYAFPYARGYGKQHDFVTVMAYVPSFGEQGNYPEKLYKFSSPDLDCNGSPCGINHTQIDGADAVRALSTRVDKLTEIRDLTVLKDSYVAVNSPYARIGFNGQTPTCSGICTQDFDIDTDVTVTAEPLAGFEFIKWGEQCDSISGKQCQLTTNALHGPTPELQEVYVEGVAKEVALDTDEVDIELGYFKDQWRVDEQTVNVGDYSLRSPYINENGLVSLTMKVAGKGKLKFWLKTSFGKENNLALRFLGSPIQVNGETGWTQYSFDIDREFVAITPLTIELFTDNANISGDHRFWVDGIKFIPDPDSNKPVTLRSSGAGSIEIQTEPYPTTCNNTCDLYPEPVSGTHTFAAIPEEGESFIGWGGACRGTEPECVVSADRYQHAYAYFTRSQSLLTSADIAKVLDNEELHFYPSRYSDEWQVQNDSSAGSTSLKASTQSGFASYTLKSYFEGEGRLSFDYKVQHESDIDSFYIFLNGQQVLLEGNTDGWATFSRELTEREHSIAWYVDYKTSESSNERLVAIDNVQWNGEPAPLIGARLKVMGAQGAIRVDPSYYCRNQCVIGLGGLSDIDNVTFFAEPDPYVEFVRWEGICADQDSHCKLTAGDLEDSQVTAVFQDVTYTVTASANEGGHASPQRQQVTAGTSADVTLTPLVGHQIADTWGCDGSLSERIYTTAAIFENCAVKAEFEKLEYQVSFDLGEYGERTGGGELEQIVQWGESAEVPEFSVTDGWHFAGWSQPFEDITANANISATYQEVEGAIRVELTVSDNASLSVEPLQYIKEGDSLSVTVNPDPGYRINQKVAGSCPTGEWEKNQYTIANITDDCDAKFSVTPVLKSGSLLLILATEGQ
ncbi:InlB B-repeat-containing protein [Idiomarina ramblicola]|nr:M12 family metallo-peptidase [Idiomarina ramblicola]